MNGDRWRQLRATFDSVCELTEPQRSAELDRLCGQDIELRAEVERLLASHLAAGSFLEVPALQEISATTTGGAGAPMAEPVPDRLGAYRVIHEIGHGGMGTVYLAEDPGLQRLVAIKVVRRGMDSELVLRHFMSEQRILARLEHPGIARLYDAGATEDGRPFFVMEFIAGEHLLESCDRRQLPLRERVELFVQVCQAVHFAHQRLIVHRDLKPSNILVTAEGAPKLLDFGLAKLLEPAVDGESPPTLLALRPMTLQYASPEQARGEVITTASDVYSLGVVLYELLSGRSPYAPSPSSRQELEQAVLSRDPERPSSAVRRLARAPSGDGGAKRRWHGAPLQRALRGDLDTIVLKALRKEPERRYGSAAELAEDLGLWSTGQPVRAQPDSLLYRSRKFVGRHRLALATLVVLALLGAGLAAVYNRRLASERDRAQRESATSQQVSAFLSSLFELSDLDRTSGVKLSARDVVDRGAQRIGTELKGQPAVAATMMTLIGQLYRGLDLRQPALTQLRQALVLRRRMAGASHPDVATSERELANVLHADGDDPAARRLLLHALSIDEAQPDGTESLETARTLTALGNVARTSGDFPAAIAFLRRAFAIELHHGPEGELAATLNSYGLAVRRNGDLRRAATIFQRVVELEVKLHGPQSPSAERALGNLGSSLTSIGDADGGIAALERALAILTVNGGRNHRDYAGTLSDLGNAWKAKGVFARALSYYEQSLAAMTANLGPLHPQTLAVRRNLGLLLLDGGDATAALGHLEVVLRERVKALGDQKPDVALSRLDLAKARAALGDNRNAEALMRRGLTDLQAQLPSDSWWVGLGEDDLGELLCKTGRRGEGVPLLTSAVHTLRQSLPANDPLVTNVGRALEECLATPAPGPRRRSSAP